MRLHPAERVELLVDFRDFRAGSQIVLLNTGGEQTTRAVVRFDVTRGGGVEEARIPHGPMRTLERLPEPTASRRCGPGAPDHRRRPVAARRPRLRRVPGRRRPRLGTTELWQWRNPSNWSHPMHLHGIIRVVERSTGVVPRAERGWKDTIGVASGETVAVQPWFVPYGGRYVFHCHNLEHGDKAMMLQLEVVA